VPQPGPPDPQPGRAAGPVLLDRQRLLEEHAQLHTHRHAAGAALPAGVLQQDQHDNGTAQRGVGIVASPNCGLHQSSWHH